MALRENYFSYKLLKSDGYIIHLCLLPLSLTPVSLSLSLSISLLFIEVNASILKSKIDIVSSLKLILYDITVIDICIINYVLLAANKIF